MNSDSMLRPKDAIGRLTIQSHQKMAWELGKVKGRTFLLELRFDCRGQRYGRVDKARALAVLLIATLSAHRFVKTGPTD